MSGISWRIFQIGKAGVLLKQPCYDNPKVEALISHLLFKYLISKWSVSAPSSIRRQESDAFPGEAVEY